MATHSRILAWRIPWTEEPGGLQSTGSHRARHDSSDLATAAGPPGAPQLLNLRTFHIKNNECLILDFFPPLPSAFGGCI